MKTLTYLKSLLIIGIFSGAILMLRNQLFLPKSSQTGISTALSDSSFGWKIPTTIFQPGGQVSNIGAYSDIRDPGGVPRGLPVRLKIPIIGVDTAIEDAYITSDGRMDVPAGSVNVAWYALGPHPGQVGSAVVGGHFGIDNGVPKVFYNLNKLKEGDKVYIEDDSGNTLAFIVRSIRLFDRNADSTPVFTSNDGLAHLNIITCEGVWNKVNDSYPDRRVVFTQAIPNEGSVTVIKPTPIKTATPTPRSPEPSQMDEDPEPSQRTTPTPTLIPQTTNPVSAGLYDTPIDGIISTSLIGSIIFVALKIIGL